MLAIGATSRNVIVPITAACCGWNWKTTVKTANQTIACSIVQAMSAVNIVSNEVRSQVSSAAKPSEPNSTLRPTADRHLVVELVLPLLDDHVAGDEQHEPSR